jgi:hypothetical protein
MREGVDNIKWRKCARVIRVIKGMRLKLRPPAGVGMCIALVYVRSCFERGANEVVVAQNCTNIPRTAV